MKAKIGLDAGHGGSSSGTYSVNSVKDGLFEKDFALEQALLIEKHLLRNGFSVAMTRRTDKNPGNVSERAKLLAKENCNFSLSIHFNGFGSESANGTEVFVPFAEKFAGIEAGFHKTLGENFKRRAPFARSSSYYDRNKKMVDSSARVITYFDGKMGGTARTIAYAQKNKLDILNLCAEAPMPDQVTFFVGYTD